LEFNLQGGVPVVVGTEARSDLGLQLPACPADLRVRSRATCDSLGVVWGFGCRPATVLRRGAFVALSRWLCSVQPSSLLGHLEPRSLFSAGSRAAGGGRAEQTQESIQRFEQQAGLRDAGYTPHKGLTTEETKYLRVAEALHKLKLQSGETAKEEKHPASAQSTPSSTPHASPKQKSRGWFPSGSSTALPAPNPHTMDPGSGNDRNSADKWSLFGPRPLQKSDSGFAIQAYKGAPRPSPMEVMRAQATRVGEDPATFKPPKMDVPMVEGKKQPLRTHNLKPRDLNVLTPTGF
ncbi:RIKEN cDNA 4833439L19, isoform CRA_a, partial [Mus musculus]